MLLQEGAEKQAQLERSLREKAAVEKELEKVRLLQVLSLCYGRKMYFKAFNSDICLGWQTTFEISSTRVEKPSKVNPLTPRSDYHVTSPHNIQTYSSKKVMRILRLIRLKLSSRSNTKFL